MAEATGWHTEDIKAALRKKHGTVRALSASWGLSQNTISAVFGDAGRSMRIERLISETLAVPLHELWPDRWHPDGTPKPRPRAAAYELRPVRNSPKREAA